VLKFRRMTRAFGLLVVALAAFAIGVVASADPPDPTWIAGFWDDDDQDSAVIAILSIRGVVTQGGLNPPTLYLIEPSVLDLTEPAIATSVFPDVESRAPPLASKYPV